MAQIVAQTQSKVNAPKLIRTKVGWRAFLSSVIRRADAVWKTVVKEYFEE